MVRFLATNFPKFSFSYFRLASFFTQRIKLLPSYVQFAVEIFAAGSSQPATFAKCCGGLIGDSSEKFRKALFSKLNDLMKT